MSSRKIIDVFSKILTKRVEALCEQITEVFIVKPGCIYSSHQTLKG
jgi:hypothetical protein